MRYEDIEGIEDYLWVHLHVTHCPSLTHHPSLSSYCFCCLLMPPPHFAFDLKRVITFSMIPLIRLAWYVCDKRRAADFPSTRKSSVCWDPLQILGVQGEESESFSYYSTDSLLALISNSRHYVPTLALPLHAIPNPETFTPAQLGHVRSLKLHNWYLCPVVRVLFCSVPCL